jgi:hypothetical protein
MDANMSVPVAVIMKFAKLQALKTDEAAISQALETSTVAVIVDGRIKANIKGGTRSTIILREIPSTTPEEEVKEIFAFEGCKTILSVHSDIEDTWFVVMDSEEDAKDTLIDLRLKKRLFRGHQVKGRLKSESMVRSFYPMQPPQNHQPMPSVFAPGMQYPPVYMNNNQQMSDMHFSPYGIIPNNNQQQLVEQQMTGFNHSNDMKNKGKTVGNMPNNSKLSSPVSAASNSRNGDRKSASNPNSTSSSKNSSSGKDSKKNSKSDSKRDNSSTQQPINNDSANFPPLQLHQIDEIPIPTPGFKTDYHKFSFDDIINIVKNIKEAVLPDTINPLHHPLSMTSSPNLDLLQRQRTFSIDETREQLRQGRPVQREAVIAGSVDYGSMMYGDDHVATPVTATPNVPKESKSSKPDNKESGSWAARIKLSSDVSAVSISTSKVDNKDNKSSSKKNVTSTTSSERKSDKKPTNNKDSNKDNKSKSRNNSRSDSNSGKSKRGDNKGGDKDNKVSDKEVKDSSEELKGSDWGGKPTFANILQQKKDAEAAAVVKAKAIAATNAVSTSNVNNDAKSISKEKKPTSSSNGVWAKETLPPLKNEGK